MIEEGTEFLDQLKDRVHDLYDRNKEKTNIINNLISYLMQMWETYESEDTIIYKLRLFGFNENDIKLIMKGEGIYE